MTNLLEAILPELQKIVALENKTSGSNITCATIDNGQDYYRIRIFIPAPSIFVAAPRSSLPYSHNYNSWLDIGLGPNQIIYHYYIVDNLLNIKLHSKQLDWTDPDLLQKLTQHIKTIANTGSGSAK